MGKAAMNVAHELLPGVSYPEWITDDARLWKTMNLNDFRVAMSDYGNANAVTFAKIYIKRLREIFPTCTIIWGINKLGNKWKASQWADLKERHILEAQYAQVNNLWYQLFNEDTNNWCIASDLVASSTKLGSVITVNTGTVKHGLMVGDSITISIPGGLMTIPTSSEPVRSIIDDYNFTIWPAHPGVDGTSTGGQYNPNPSMIRGRYISLASELRGLSVTIPLIGSVGQGGLSTWMSGGGEITLALNIYGEGNTVAARLANFKSQVDTFITIPQPTGAPKMLTEIGCHASSSLYPPLYADQVADIKAKLEYGIDKCDKVFFHCWRSNAWSGNQNDAYAMRLTWTNTFAPLNIRWTEAF